MESKIFAIVAGVAATASVLLGTSMTGVFSKSQMERGAGIYREKCAACHGDQLEGGDHAPSLEDDVFWHEWNGKTARSLYSRIISTMPPDDTGSLAPKDVIDVVAHIAAVSGVQPGTVSIERADELNTVTLEQPK